MIQRKKKFSPQKFDGSKRIRKYCKKIVIENYKIIKFILNISFTVISYDYFQFSIMFLIMHIQSPISFILLYISFSRNRSIKEDHSIKYQRQSLEI